MCIVVNCLYVFSEIFSEGYVEKEGVPRGKSVWAQDHKWRQSSRAPAVKLAERCLLSTTNLLVLFHHHPGSASTPKFNPSQRLGHLSFFLPSLLSGHGHEDQGKGSYCTFRLSARC